MTTLLARLRAVSGRAAKAETPEEDPAMNEDEDKAPEAEGDQPGDETAMNEDEDKEPEAEGGEEEPKTARAATITERRRILAILGHANAEANAGLAVELIRDGTAAAKATRLLSVAAPANPARPGLAGRMAAAQGTRKPGADAPAAAAANPLLAMAQARRNRRDR